MIIKIRTNAKITDAGVKQIVGTIDDCGTIRLLYAGSFLLSDIKNITIVCQRSITDSSVCSVICFPNCEFA